MNQKVEHQQAVNILMVRVKEGGFILLIALGGFFIDRVMEFFTGRPGLDNCERSH